MVKAVVEIKMGFNTKSYSKELREYERNPTNKKTFDQLVEIFKAIDSGACKEHHTACVKLLPLGIGYYYSLLNTRTQQAISAYCSKLNNPKAPMWNEEHISLVVHAILQSKNPHHVITRCREFIPNITDRDFDQFASIARDENLVQIVSTSTNEAMGGK